MTGDPLDTKRMNLALAVSQNKISGEAAWELLHTWDALVEVARAAREIRDTAKWYADNDARLAQEVDHALCVEVYSLADNALARLDGPR